MLTETPTIAISSLKIRDFRGIDQLDFDFRGPDGLPNRLVVIGGPNGSGKTAVLEAALLACGGHALMTGVRGPEAIRRGKKSYQVNARIEYRGTSVEVVDTPRMEAPEPRPSIPHWYFSSWRAPKLVGPVDVTLGRPGRKSAKTDANRLKNIKEILVNAAAVERYRESQGELFSEVLNSGTNNYSGWIDLINTGWREFYPGANQEFLVGLVVSERKSRGSFDVLLAGPSRDGIGVDRLSAGQLEVFLFLSALALNDDSEGIVFIDEPELHLDPQWHRPIVRSLMRLQPRAQFIIATHSPEIYDSAQSYERHFLVPDDDPRARIWGEVRTVGAGA